MNEERARGRKRLDRKLVPLRPIERFVPPPSGWIRSIRDALGMTGAQLAKRMTITAQSVVGLEQSEASGSIRLASLRKAAAALECDLVYALVPRGELDHIVERRARAIAITALDCAANPSPEIDEFADDETEERIERYVASTLRDRDLWCAEEKEPACGAGVEREARGGRARTRPREEKTRNRDERAR